jgi:putative selenate reductase
MLDEHVISQVKQQRARKVSQNHAPLLSPDKRQDFALVEPTFEEHVAQDEATRCLQCSSFCDKCVEVCPNRANYSVLIDPVTATMPRVSLVKGQIEVVGEDDISIEQARQIIHVDDLCNECGNCATFCVHQGSPYKEKPRLFLSKHDFEAETDNAFRIEGGSNGWTIYRREEGIEYALSLPNTGNIQFSSDLLEASISADSFQVVDLVHKQDSELEISLVSAIEMHAVLQGVLASMSFLPL